MLILEIITFGFCFWLGLYLLRREDGSSAMNWTAGGLISYAAALMLGTFGRFAPDGLAEILRLQVPILLAPLACWIMAIWLMRDRLREIGGGLRALDDPKTAVGLIIISTVTFGLGLGLIVLPFEIAWLPRSWIILAISVDLLLLGYGISILDAFEAGEALLPDFLRSLLEAESIAAIFGIQIWLVMRLATGVTFPMVILLFFVVGTAVFVQTFGRQIQDRFDALVFGRNPQLAEERKSLREFTDALPRQTNGHYATEPSEFIKQTRRALSHLNNLPKLSTSPLTSLPQVDASLSENGQPDHTLNRANALQSLLTESIITLKPAAEGDFEPTKSWRHFNSLYFPYVRGLRPYSRPGDLSLLSDIDRKALEWLQAEVPPRTLYNWQGEAAKLIATQLLEQAKSES